MSNEPPKPVSVKFSSVIHLTVDNYYLRGFGLISISVSLWQVFPWGKKKLHKRLYALPGILAYISHSALCLHHGFVHGSIHLFVALPISMVQEGLRKRLILPGGQYPDHVLHSFAGPAPPLPFHAIAVEPVIRFCSTQVDFCMDAALAQAWDIGSISFQIALQFVDLLQIRLCSGAAPGSIHPYGNPFHNIVGLVKLSDNTVYQFPLAEAEPGPDLFMYMITVTEVLVIQAAFYHLLKVLKLVPEPSIPIR